MKSTIISIIFLLIILPKGIAQVVISDGIYFNRAGRQVWVTKMDGEKLDRGLLWKVSKDSVFVLPTSIKTIGPEDPLPEPIRFHYNEIESLTTLKNRPGITGLWKGAIIGLISGVVINNATFQEVESTFQFFDKGETNLLAGLFGAVMGAGGGAAVATVAKKNWKISGEKNKFDDVIVELDKRAYWNRSTKPKRIK